MFSNLFTYYWMGDSELTVSKGLYLDSDPACSLKTPPIFSVQQLLLQILFSETQYFGSALLQRSVCEKGQVMGGSHGPSKASLEQLHSSGTSSALFAACLQTALLIQSWEVFALAALLTLFVDSSPECSSSHPSCNLRSEDRLECLMVSAGQGVSPFPPLGNGDFVSAFFKCFSRALFKCLAISQSG